MLLRYYILFTVTIYSVLSDDCITYTFGEDLPVLFVDDLVGCTNHQWTRLQWSHEVYSNSTIPPPNGKSKWYITPPGGFSCTSSFLFTMTPGGLLEVLTYFETTPGNSLSILVHEHGSNRLAARIQVIGPGWQVTKVTLSGTTDFVGYITFTGTRTIRSVVIVDSFRYVAPSLDPKECVVYPDDNFNTTLPTTTLPATTTDTIISTTTDTTIPTTTDTTTLDNDCVKYTFEEDFGRLFVNNTQCVNIFGVQTSWFRHEYSNSTIIPPNEQSKWFISPSSSYSCISSFNFKMMSDGLIEIHAYIDAKKPDDYLEVWAHKIVDSSYHTLVGHVILHNVDSGWNVWGVNLFDGSATPFEGYITFTGLANPNSNVIVDSFRYLAPSSDPKQCTLYQDPDKVPTTIMPTTTETTDLNDDCVKYTFEEDFEKSLANKTPCVDMFGVQTSWSRHDYSNSTVIPPNEQSKWFISPSSSYSCISSFNFTMMSDGLIEVHAYIDADAQDDYLEVWVHKIVDSSYHTLVGHGFLHAVDHGWHIMSIYLSADTATPFEGYITFTGLANPDSLVIIDSFRYVGPSLDPEECILYQDTPTAALPSTPTTTEGMILTTTDIPTLTTADTTDTDSDKDLEKIIIIKKIKTIRIESTVIKKVFRFHSK